MYITSISRSDSDECDEIETSMKPNITPVAGWINFVDKDGDEWHYNVDFVSCISIEQVQDQ